MASAKGMEIIRKSDIPRRIVGAIRAPQEEVVVSRGGVVKHGKQDVEHRKPGEGAMDVALTGAAFWGKSELLGVCESLEVPVFEGKGSAC